MYGGYISLRDERPHQKNETYKNKQIGLRQYVNENPYLVREDCGQGNIV